MDATPVDFASVTLWERQVKSKCPDSRSPIVQKKNKRRMQSLFSDPKVSRFSCLPFISGVPGPLLGGSIFFFFLACRVLVITLRYDHAEYSAVR